MDPNAFEETPKGLFDRPVRSPRESLARLTVRELVGLLMTPFLYEFTSLRLRVLACTLDDIRMELRRREGLEVGR